MTVLPCTLLVPCLAGTHVAGIIGAKNTGKGVVGVSPSTGIYSLKILDSQGNGVLSDAMRAIKWVIAEGSAKGIKVINLSLAGHVDPTASYYKAMVDLFCGVCKEASDAGAEGWGVTFSCHFACYMRYMWASGMQACTLFSSCWHPSETKNQLLHAGSLICQRSAAISQRVVATICLLQPDLNLFCCFCCTLQVSQSWQQQAMTTAASTNTSQPSARLL
jgi:hypothetical protein